MKRLMILDGSSLMFRAFYALPLLSAPTGEYTNAVFGFANMMMKLIHDYAPHGMVVAFDKSRHTFRTEMYAAYKGTRQETPAEFSPQVPLLRELLDCWGIPFLELDNYEADDIIGTLAVKAAAAGDFETFIVTGDRDALQLVRPSVSVLFTKRGISEMTLFDEAAFEAAYGFAPIRLIDLKGLMGDATDNIPGVPGVGEKTATKLLLTYGSMEAIFDHLSDVSGKKLRERLTENQAQAELSKQLATIDCDVPIMFAPESYQIQPDGQRVIAFCERYGLRSVKTGFMKLYPAAVADSESVQAPWENVLTVEVLDSREAAEEFLRKVRAVGQFAFVGHYEGRVPQVKMLGAGLATQGQTAYAAMDSEGWPLIWQLLQDEAIERDTIHLKSFYHAGGAPSGSFFDAALAGYLLDPVAGGGDAEHLRAVWGIDLPTCPAGITVEQQTAWQAATVFALRNMMREKLKERHLEKLYREIELPVIEVLAAMESAGVYVNREQLQIQGEAIQRTIEALSGEIFALAGHEFNVNSPQQLGEVLFTELGLPVKKKTKRGGYSTDAEVLESLRSDHPIIEKILGYRMWTKLKSTYIDAIDGIIDPGTRRVHTQFNQMVTATGRLSSSEPNLQNIPVRTEEGRAIRRLFEPGEGYDYLLSADYSQIELRLLAHLSQDEGFMAACVANEDIHARTAAEVFGIGLGEVTPEQRRHAKAVNFGIVYGISDYGLARDLGISRQEAARYIESYFSRYGGVRRFLYKTVEAARENGFVTTMFGRRRDLPEIYSRNFNRRSLAERMAMNTPIQGLAADIMKMAMVAAHRRLTQVCLKSRILLQVHDELVLEVTAQEQEQVAALLVDVMENVVELSVPLLVEVHQGKNWAEAK